MEQSFTLNMVLDALNAYNDQQAHESTLQRKRLAAIAQSPVLVWVIVNRACGWFPRIVIPS